MKRFGLRDTGRSELILGKRGKKFGGASFDMWNFNFEHGVVALSGWHGITLPNIVSQGRNSIVADPKWPFPAK